MGGMKVGLHVPNFAWDGGPDALSDHLANVAEAAEAAGFDQLTIVRAEVLNAS